MKWETDCSEHDMPYEDVIVREVGTRQHVATFRMDDAPLRDYNSRQLANANLTAAAPELQAALEALLLVVEKLPQKGLAYWQAKAALSKVAGHRIPPRAIVAEMTLEDKAAAPDTYSVCELTGDYHCRNCVPYTTKSVKNVDGTTSAIQSHCDICPLWEAVAHETPIVEGGSI